MRKQSAFLNGRRIREAVNRQSEHGGSLGPSKGSWGTFLTLSSSDGHSSFSWGACEQRAPLFHGQVRVLCCFPWLVCEDHTLLSPPSRDSSSPLASVMPSCHLLAFSFACYSLRKAAFRLCCLISVASFVWHFSATLQWKDSGMEGQQGG